MASKETNTKWFLYCGDAHSNEVVARTLNDLQGTVTDFKFTVCADDVKRPLYEVPDYSFANRLHRSQKQLKATLQIFTSQNDGKPKAWAPIVKKPKNTLAAIRRKSNAIKKNARMP